MNEVKKGLSVDVLKTVGYPDCSGGGVTSKFSHFVLLTDNPRAQVFKVTEDSPALRLVKRTIGGEPYVHAEPDGPAPKGCVGPMAGGAFVYSCDSRFREITGVSYPISVHDRYETVEDYNRNCD